MKPEEIAYTVDLIRENIINNIGSLDLMSDAEVQKFYRNIEATLDEFGVEVSAMLDEQIYAAYAAGLIAANELTKALGFDFKDSLNSMVHTGALNAMTNDTMLDMKAAIRTAKMTSVSSIDSALAQVRDNLSESILYGSSRDKVVKEVMQSFNQHGLKAFITVDGKMLPLDFYSETITRTKLSSARTTAHANHYAEVDNQYYTIHGSYDTCDECAAHRGIVFTMTGEDSRFPYLDPKEAIPFHPNCKCNIRPEIIDNLTDKEVDALIKRSNTFNPDVDNRTKAQKKAYADDQTAKRKARAELKQYNNIVAALGKDAPKTLGAYRRMKRANSKGYKVLMSKLRSG